MPSERLRSVQVLRALAALAVTVAHFHAEFALKFGLDVFPGFVVGAAGVDLFFVISGFIIVYVSEPLFGRPGGARDFLFRRIVRLVPLYWLASAIVLAHILRAYPDVAAANHTWPNIVGSFLFWPLPRPDGTYAPVLGVGWSLNYEMLFYAILAAAIPFARRTAVLLAGAAILVLVYLVPLTPLARLATIDIWANPIILEFVFGMAIAVLYRAGLRLPAWLAVLAVAAGAGLLAWTGPTEAGTWHREWAWGGAGALVVAGCVLADVRPLRSPVWMPLVFVGDASYALYLFHPFTSALPRLLFPGLALPAEHPWLFALLMLTLGLAVASAIHLAIERPLARWAHGGRAVPSRRTAGPTQVGTAAS